MLRISFQTLRARRGTLAGAFVAIWLAVTLAYGTGLLMDGALSAPGPGRFAAAEAVLRAKPADPTTARAAARRRARRVEGGVDDVAFPVGAWAGGRRLGTEPLHAHGWASAALTPYRLTSGRAPSGPREVVADERAGRRHAGARRRARRARRPPRHRHRPRPGRPADAVLRRRTAAPPVRHPGPASTRSPAPRRARRRHARDPRRPLPRATAAATRRRRLAALEVLDRAHAADADAGDPRAADRAALVAIFGTMGGIAGAVALFVVAGTFTLAITQRRREVAVLRALGAAPHQVRRLIAGEALIVSVVAGALGMLAGRPLADAIVSILADHGTVPRRLRPGRARWIPLVAAFGGGILVAQLAVFAAARRAGRTRPAEALREAAIEHARPGVLQLLVGALCLGGGIAMALIFKGMWAVAFAILEGLLLAIGVGLLGRALLGLPAALLACPLRRLGASGLLAGTSLAANRWRTAALATPIVLVAMLAGTQGVVQDSGRRDTEARHRRARDGAVRRHRPRRRAGPGDGRAPSSRSCAASTAWPRSATTELYPDGALGENAPWPPAAITAARRPHARPGLHPRLAGGRPGDRVAVSRVFAESGDLHPGRAVHRRTAARCTSPRSTSAPPAWATSSPRRRRSR